MALKPKMVSLINKMNPKPEILGSFIIRGSCAIGMMTQSTGKRSMDDIVEIQPLHKKARHRSNNMKNSNKEDEVTRNLTIFENLKGHELSGDEGLGNLQNILKWHTNLLDMVTEENDSGEEEGEERSQEDMVDVDNDDDEGTSTDESMAPGTQIRKRGKKRPSKDKELSMRKKIVIFGKRVLAPFYLSQIIPFSPEFEKKAFEPVDSIVRRDRKNLVALLFSKEYDSGSIRNHVLQCSEIGFVDNSDRMCFMHNLRKFAQIRIKCFFSSSALDPDHQRSLLPFLFSSQEWMVIERKSRLQNFLRKIMEQFIQQVFRKLTYRSDDFAVTLSGAYPTKEDSRRLFLQITKNPHEGVSRFYIMKLLPRPAFSQPDLEETDSVLFVSSEDTENIERKPEHRAKDTKEYVRERKEEAKSPEHRFNLVVGDSNGTTSKRTRTTSRTSEEHDAISERYSLPISIKPERDESRGVNTNQIQSHFADVNELCAEILDWVDYEVPPRSSITQFLPQIRYWIMMDTEEKHFEPFLRYFSRYRLKQPDGKTLIDMVLEFMRLANGMV